MIAQLGLVNTTAIWPATLFRYNCHAMAHDTKKWHIGVSRLNGLIENLPSSFDEDDVEHYHGIISALEEASGEDLSVFRIPANKLERRITSVTRGSYTGGPGSVTYSHKRYCNGSYFRSQLHALSDYVSTLGGESRQANENPFESLSDHQLENLMVGRGIKPKRVSDRGDDRWVYDRAHAIAQLLRSDQPDARAAVSLGDHLKSGHA